MPPISVITRILSRGNEAEMKLILVMTIWRRTDTGHDSRVVQIGDALEIELTATMILVMTQISAS